MKLRTIMATLRAGATPSGPGGSPHPRPVLRVELRDERDNRGVGEAIPRDEISGETADSALTFVQAHQAHWLDALPDVPSLQAWSAANSEIIDWSPAAWTAFELAMLDLMANRGALSTEALLELPPAISAPRATAVLGEGSTEQFDSELTRFICAGHRDYKVSLSGDARVDRTRVEALQAGHIGGDQARAAAHHLWLTVEQADDYLWQLGFPWWAVEEPLAAGALGELRRLSDLRALRIVLDDSVQRTAHLEALGGDPTRWLVVLHVTKLGGLLRASHFVRRARELGIELILVTSPVDPPSVRRAQICLGAQAADILRAQEGAARQSEFSGASVNG